MQLRKKLIETSLIGVISLPAGVFQPYSGVKTSILILDKEKSKKIANQLVQDQRVQHAVKNDYSEGEELDTVIKNFILSL